MKPKKKSKTKSRSKSKSRPKTRPHAIPKSKTEPISNHQALPTPNLTTTSSLKTCQEVEVGDIGGFGSTVELEAHEKRCNEQATEFCTNCGKNLCHNHYDLVHRDHDRALGPHTSSSVA